MRIAISLARYLGTDRGSPSIDPARIARRPAGGPVVRPAPRARRAPHGGGAPGGPLPLRSGVGAGGARRAHVLRAERVPHHLAALGGAAAVGPDRPRPVLSPPGAADLPRVLLLLAALDRGPARHPPA